MAQPSIDGEGDFSSPNLQKRIEMLYREQGRKVVSSTSRKGINPADAEDDFQEVFVKFLEGSRNFPVAINRPTAFVITCTRRERRDFIRADRKREKIESTFAQQARLDAIPCLYHTAEYLEYDHLIAIIRGKLNDREFALLLLIAEGKYTYKEIAVRQGKNEPAIRQAVHRLREKLQNALWEEFENQEGMWIKRGRNSA